MSALARIFQDPPPEYAFEISSDGIAMSRTRPPAVAQFAALPEGALTPSPIRENIADPAAVAAAVGKLVPASGGRRTAAIILPDNAVRLAVLEFDSLPEKDLERLALIRFRLRKTVPFDVDRASVSYFIQSGNKVLVAVAAAEVIAQYESIFRSVGLQPGIVTPGALALLELFPASGSYLVAHRNSGTLAVLVIGNGVLTLARSLELSSDAVNPIDEIVSDLYATRIYVEDKAGVRPNRLYLAGFDDEAPSVAKRLAGELDVEVEIVDEEYPGLAGYLRSVSAPVSGKAAA